MKEDTAVGYPRKRIRSLLFGLLWSIVSPLCLVAVGKLVAPGGGPPWWGGFALASLLLLGVVGGGVAASRAQLRRAAIEIADGALVVDRAGRREKIPLDRIESAAVLPVAVGEELELSLVGGDEVTIHFAKAGDAATWQKKLGLDASRRRTRLRMQNAGQRALITGAGGLLGGLAWLIGAGLVADFLPRTITDGTTGVVIALATLLPLLVASAAYFQQRLPELTIGVDGISLRGAFGVRRGARPKAGFIPFEAISGVETKAVEGGPRQGRGEPPVELVVFLREPGADGTGRLVLAQAPLSEMNRLVAAEDRIREAMAMARSESPDPAQLAGFDRGAQSLTEWIDALRAIARRKTDYRSTGVTPDQLASLLEDATAPADRRIAAALVLRERGADQARSKIRIAADTSASPKLRIALESIATESATDAEMEHALEEATRAETQEPEQTA